MIEISDEKYWRELNYYDGLLYCQLLEIDGKNDWRMFKDVHEVNSCRYPNTNVVTGVCWNFRDGNKFNSNFLNLMLYMIIPVRDI